MLLLQISYSLSPLQPNFFLCAQWAEAHSWRSVTHDAVSENIPVCTWTLVQISANLVKQLSVIVKQQPQLKRTFQEMVQHFLVHCANCETLHLQICFSITDKIQHQKETKKFEGT